MVKALCFALIALAPMSFAEGPGSRIRGDPGVVAPPSMLPKRADALDDERPCAALREDEKARCIRRARERTPPVTRSGPESTGMGSGAGASSATGHGSPGSSAPR